MIRMKVKILIPKFVVTIYRLSFLWPLKQTFHFFYQYRSWVKCLGGEGGGEANLAERNLGGSRGETPENF